MGSPWLTTKLADQCYYARITSSRLVLGKAGVSERDGTESSGEMRGSSCELPYSESDLIYINVRLISKDHVALVRSGIKTCVCVAERNGLSGEKAKPSDSRATRGMLSASGARDRFYLSMSILPLFHSTRILFRLL